MSDLLGHDARSLLDATRHADDPSADDAARVRAKLAARLAAAATVTAAGTATIIGAKAALDAAGAGSVGGAVGMTGAAGAAGAGLAGGGTAVGSALTAKIIGAVALVVATSGAGMIAHRAMKDDPLSRTVATSTSAPPVVASAPSAVDTPASAPMAPKAPEERLAKAASGESSTSAMAAVDATNGSRAAPIARPRGPVAPAAAPLTSNEKDVRAKDRGEPLPVASADASASADALASEALLLRAARSALGAGDGSRALASLDEHERRFPHGALEPERLASRVLALCAVGRTTEAQQAAAAFLSAHATSPLARGVEHSCATTKAPTSPASL